MTRDKKQAPAQASRGDTPDLQFPLQNRPKPHQLLNYAAFAKTNGLAVELAKMNEIAELLWPPSELSKEDRDARIVKAIDLFNAIKPADAIESMLATQMLGTHAAAVDCLRRAMVPGQTLESREMTMKHAQKLMTLYTQQMAALDKYRGKGQQKIIVERVTVQSGGQAIVGNIGTDAVASPPIARRRKVAPLQITSVPTSPNPLDGLRDPVPRQQGEDAKAAWLNTPVIPGRCARHGVAAPGPARAQRARRLPLPTRPAAECTAARARARPKATGTR